MTEWYEKTKRAEERDRATIEALKTHPVDEVCAERQNTRQIVVGWTFYRWINQADRFCEVVAVRRSKLGAVFYVYVYEMSNGREFYRLGNTARGVERPISKLPAWALKQIEPVTGVAS